MAYACLYVFSVVICNFAFIYVPLLTLPNGDQWSPVALVVGFVFIVRDYVQRAIGHYILWAMAIAAVLSWLMASPAVALASVCAFCAGELLDWAVYTFTGRPFAERILLSSAVSTPVDSAIFLAMVGMFSWPSLLVMTASKMVSALFIFFLIKRRMRPLPQ